MTKCSLLFVTTVLLLFMGYSARVINDEEGVVMKSVKGLDDSSEIYRHKRQIGVGMGNEDADAMRDTFNYLFTRAKNNKEKVGHEILRGASGGAVGGAVVGSIAGPAGAGLGALKGAATGGAVGGLKAIVYDAIVETSNKKKNDEDEG
ncbi:hypothetical protein HHI36_012809 [Cryptolaemus montrouzieri]|uniref:Glycine-zipper-containing OmpA-like membrane domain-containing protein n=1 Tax=Cryptolaemus montrouzieri TaxID=559131 RepID=A0ABD2NFK4_9CUCU